MGWLSGRSTSKTVLQFDECLKEYASASREKREELIGQGLNILSTTNKKEVNAIARNRPSEVYEFLIDVLEHSNSGSNRRIAARLLPPYAGDSAIKPLRSIIEHTTDPDLAREAIRSLAFGFGKKRWEEVSRFMLTPDHASPTVHQEVMKTWFEIHELYVVGTNSRRSNDICARCGRDIKPFSAVAADGKPKYFFECYYCRYSN
jgi:hypothetical protein